MPNRLGADRQAIRYNLIDNPVNGRARIKNMLEHTIHEIILQASQTDILQMPLPN